MLGKNEKVLTFMLFYKIEIFKFSETEFCASRNLAPGAFAPFAPPTERH